MASKQVYYVLDCLQSIIRPSNIHEILLTIGKLGQFYSCYCYSSGSPHALILPSDVGSFYLTYSTKEIHDKIGVPAKRYLEVCEVLDCLQARYYAIEEATDIWLIVRRGAG